MKTPSRRFRVVAALLLLVSTATIFADDADRAAADAAFDAGRWADAAALFVKYVERRPSDASAWRRLAIADLENGDVAEAKKALAREEALEGRAAIVEFVAGRIALVEGAFDEAARAFAAVRKADATCEPAWTLQNLGYALHRLSRFEEARKAYREALARPVAELGARIYLNAARNEIALDALAQALALTTRGREAFPTEPWLADLHGWALSISGDATGASAAYARARGLARARAPAGATPVVAPPMAGRLRVVQGPGGAFSHESLRNAEAADVVVLDAAGREFRGDGAKNDDYFCFGRPVLAMADGDVVAVRDGVADNRPGETTSVEPRGNHVYVRSGPGLYTRYFHLRAGSVAAKVGQHVRRGDVVGRCGNSGFSRKPHVCVAVVASPPEEDLSVPMRFGPCTLWTDGTPRPVDALAPTEGMVFESRK